MADSRTFEVRATLSLLNVGLRIDLCWVIDIEKAMQIPLTAVVLCAGNPQHVGSMKSVFSCRFDGDSCWRWGLGPERLFPQEFLV
jgi:hypothetical protein